MSDTNKKAIKIPVWVHILLIAVIVGALAERMRCLSPAYFLEIKIHIIEIAGEYSNFGKKEESMVSGGNLSCDEQRKQEIQHFQGRFRLSDVS